jgi:hypothetical protein
VPILPYGTDAGIILYRNAGINTALDLGLARKDMVMKISNCYDDNGTDGGFSQMRLPFLFLTDIAMATNAHSPVSSNPGASSGASSSRHLW